MGATLMDLLWKPNFLALHYAYFILTCVIGSVIIYTASTQIYSTNYVEALFMCISAMTGTGLSVLDLSTQNHIQQATLFSLMLLGHALPISGIILAYRGKSIHRITRTSAGAKPTEGVLPHTLAIGNQTKQPSEEGCQSFPGKADLVVCDRPVPETTIETKGDPSECLPRREFDSLSLNIIFPTASSDKQSSWRDKITHLVAVRFRCAALVQYIEKHSQSEYVFHPDEESGVLAAKAAYLLSLIVLIYFTLIFLVGILAISLWLEYNLPNIARAYNVTPSWAGAFLAMSAFTNNGMSLLDANMVPFQQEWFPLVAVGGLIVAGNALYPCFLRLAIWSLRQVLPAKGHWHSWQWVLDFILSQSQNIYPYLFSARQTWSLFGINLILNGIMWGAFELSSVEATEPATLPIGYKALDGIFQALAVRGGGFCVVALNKLPQALLVLYLIMMYISAFPVPATISKTDSTQKQLEGSRDSEVECHGAPRAKGTFKWAYCRHVYEQICSQLNHDLWWIALAVICITVAEGDHYRSQPLDYSTFNIIFEVVSACSCIGVSIGYPGKTYSFCGEWHTFSKLVLAGVALRGKHRGVPLAFDNGLLLREAQDWIQNYPT